MVLLRPASHNPDGSREVFHPPLGLWSMRTNNFGKSVLVLDLHVQPLPENLHTDVAGYSVMFPSHFHALTEIRKHVHAELEVLGGPEGSLRSLSNVLTVPGDGESWLAGRHVPLQELELPWFRTEELKPYWKSGLPFGIPTTRRWMSLETSRGCFHRCNFCASCRMWPKWQGHSVEKISEYLDYLLKDHEIEEIQIIDDNIAWDKERFLGIIEALRRRTFFWSCSNGIYVRRLLERDVLEALKNSGCLYLSLPFEAGNERSASLMNLGAKYIDFDDAMEVTLKLKNLGIRTSGQFVIGYPGETEKEVVETLRYANALALDERHIHIAMALRGTPLYETCWKNGYFDNVPDSATYKTPAISTPWLTRERLYELWLEDRRNHV